MMQYKIGSDMEYTLILSDGRIMRFYNRTVAEMYQKINGGTLVDNGVLSLDNWMDDRYTVSIH